VKKPSNGKNILAIREYIKAGMDQDGTKLIFEIKTSTQGKERSLKLTKKIG
jgi:glycerophosphoryl diester phosphodiesterase